MNTAESISQELEETLLSLDRIQAESLITNLVSKMSFASVVERNIIPSMESIGRKWEKGEVALSQVFMGGKILEEIVDKLMPVTDKLRGDDPNIALVLYKDHHILGMRIVASILKASGYAIKNYGQQYDISDLITKIKEDEIEILLISVLMLNSALDIKNLTAQIKMEKLATKVVVGGAPFRFDEKLGAEIGADYYSTQASQVLDIIEKIKGEKS